MLKSRKIFLKVLILLLNQPTFGSMVYFFLAFFLGTFHIKKWEQKKKNGNIFYILHYLFLVHRYLFNVANSSQM